MLKINQNKFSRFFKKLHFLSVGVFILILIFFAALVTFILIAKNIFIGNTYAFDTKAFAFADAHI
ncbi:MAG: hypothetical protein ABIN04_04035, partial [Ginsengibacter sp.]